MEICIQGFENAGKLRKAVEESIKLFQKEWCKYVTVEVTAGNKFVMVSGPCGIGTQSDHCANGYLVSKSKNIIYCVLLLFCADLVIVCNILCMYSTLVAPACDEQIQ
jgi:hypothetical protein